MGKSGSSTQMVAQDTAQSAMSRRKLSKTFDSGQISLRASQSANIYFPPKPAVCLRPIADTWFLEHHHGS
jgi:hypothetical protein